MTNELVTAEITKALITFRLHNKHQVHYESEFKCILNAFYYEIKKLYVQHCKQPGNNHFKRFYENSLSSVQ